jgi:phosphotransferase system  glucose/maltose/N-acetylglucosamine-specific IIC component
MEGRKGKSRHRRGKKVNVAEIEVPQSRRLKRVRLAARIISLLPGASLILAIGVYSIHGYFPTGEPGVLYYLTPVISGLPFLLVALLAWNWHRVGGILLILMAPFLFGTPGVDIYEPLFGLYVTALSFIGGILHLLVSPCGRRLWHKAQ